MSTLISHLWAAVPCRQAAASAGHGVPGPRRAVHGPPAPARDRRYREPPAGPRDLIDEIKDFRAVLASTKAATGAAAARPLTPAELRLLPYLQTHLTADKIAERLFLSSHTVRSEVRTIYRKLGVSSRNDAVQKATAIGLLGG